MNIKNKLKKLDLMPLGLKETLPVTITKTNIPPFKKLLPIGHKVLYQDFLNFDKSAKYVSDRKNIFIENNIDINEYRNYMDSLGFNKENYCVYPLRDVNNNFLFSESSHTAAFFSDWPTNIFRPQYNFTKKPWHAIDHIDYTNTGTHGFRVLVPLNKSFKIRVEDIEYELVEGYSYFIDVTRKHSAWSDAGRAVLSFQMADDSLL
tara:strand:- start:3895 stop:4509 length:615 start_codon:yes stop_codon:yes gene_type:complete